MTEQRTSPMMATFNAAFQNVLVDAQNQAVSRLINDLAREHMAWHQKSGEASGSGCHTCVLIGIAVAPVEEPPQS